MGAFKGGSFSSILVSAAASSLTAFSVGGSGVSAALSASVAEAASWSTTTSGSGATSGTGAILGAFFATRFGAGGSLMSGIKSASCSVGNCGSAGISIGSGSTATFRSFLSCTESGADERAGAGASGFTSTASTGTAADTSLGSTDCNGATSATVSGGVFSANIASNSWAETIATSRTSNGSGSSANRLPKATHPSSPR